MYDNNGNNRNPLYQHPLMEQGQVLDPFVSPAGGGGQPAGRAPEGSPVVQVEFPKNLFIPPGAQSLDIRRAADVATGTVNELFMSYIAPEAAAVIFTHYAVFSDSTLAASQSFIPRKQGKRIFPYHGDPGVDGKGSFQINLGLGPDLSNINLISCDLRVNPGEKVEWLLTNTSGATQAMGVRMVGYLDYIQKRINNSVGG